MALPLFPPNFPIPSQPNGAAGQHFDIDSGFPIPSAPNGTPGYEFEIDSGFVTPGIVDAYGPDVVSASSDISDDGEPGELGIREVFSCTSLRESFFVGRDSGVEPVEGVIIRANPTHKNLLPSGISDTDGYTLFISDVTFVVDPPARETFKVPRFRVAGGRGRRGGGNV